MLIKRFGLIKLVGGHATTLLVYNPGQSGLQQVVTSAFATTKVTLASSPAEVTAAFGPNGTSKKAAEMQAAIDR